MTERSDGLLCTFATEQRLAGRRGAGAARLKPDVRWHLKNLNQRRFSSEATGGSNEMG